MFDITMQSNGCLSLSDLANCQSVPSHQPHGTAALPSNTGGSFPNITTQQGMPAQSPRQNTPSLPPSYMHSQPPSASRQRPQGNGVYLKKGQKVTLGENNQALTQIRVCLGWDVINQACDLDTSAFLLGSNGRVIGDDWFVFYGQTASPDGAVVHHGDSDGRGCGDDEVVEINLQQLNPNVSKLVFVVTINEAFERNLNFSMVANAYVRVVNEFDGRELVRFDLSDYYTNVCSMVVGELYAYNGQWKFNAVGNGLSKDLAGLCAAYGVRVADS